MESRIRLSSTLCANRAGVLIWAPPLAVVHLKGTKKLGFVLMEAPPGITGRLFVAVEPQEQERRAQYMAQETVKWFSQDKGYGGTKDNVRDELDDAAGRGRHDRDDRKEAAPEEVGQPGSGGVKDNVRDEWAESQESR